MFSAWLKTLGETRPGLLALAFSSLVWLACSLPLAVTSQPATPQPPTEPTQAASEIAATPAGVWAAGLSISNAGQIVVGNLNLASSSKLLVSWTPPVQAIDHYVVAAADGASVVSSTADAAAASLILTPLESATEYTVSLIACADSACRVSLAADAPATGRTAEEYWQVQGTGNSFETATHLVEDGNTKPYPVVYGDWAGAELAGKIQLYYDTLVHEEKGVKIGQLLAPRADSLAAVSAFSPVSDYGLRYACQFPPPKPNQPPTPFDCPGVEFVKGVFTFQAVPLSAEMGGVIRLFFEADGADRKTRVLYVDSRDGYVGRDFNAGEETLCDSADDYVSGGGCAPTLQIGVEGDSIAGNPKVTAARQFKIGYPTLDDWRWNGAPGTFMFVTLDLASECSGAMFNSGYAVWDGAAWNLQYRDDGCPKAIQTVQAPMPVHLGGVRYKLYFSNNTGKPGQPSSISLDDKPLKLLYADGSLKGSPDQVDFEDWEPIEAAREVHVLWPDGTELDVAHESRFDDYAVFTPTQSLDFQVIYANMSLPGREARPPFIGAAVLLNP